MRIEMNATSSTDSAAQPDDQPVVKSELNELVIVDEDDLLGSVTLTDDAGDDRDLDAARAIRRIREEIGIPLIGDIHFDWRLAVAAMEYGAQGIRINPGNLGGPDNLRKVVDAAAQHQVPIRVGVNSGSIETSVPTS